MQTKKKTSQKKSEVGKVSKISKTRISDVEKTYDFPIVGIGASAGGLEALEQFFGNMPENSGIAFVVIQHLDPTHVGIMPELLQRTTHMKVLQATDQLEVKPDCVYVIPPNKSMSLLHGALHLFDPVESRGLRLPVDIFFRSLADDRQEKSIGVILSGMGSDGRLGLKAIKEKKGMVVVQDPGSAKYDGMPRSAIEAVIADIVAPANELPAKLIAFLKFVPAVNKEFEKEQKNKNNLDKIIILLREYSGNDFSLYKKNTLFRRIERRKSIHQIDKIQDYVHLLQENPKEVEILFNELLIGVTSFFRDVSVWDKLGETILPELINEMPDGHIIRAWVPGCSTGEEAYSLAIVFKEAMEKKKVQKRVTLQVFATDLDREAIEKARRGVFSSTIISDLSPERISRFFTPVGKGFRVNNSIRELVVFAPQNVIKDPPFTKLDFLSCRNLLIYLESELQENLMTLFNYSLNPGGIMLLGSAENIGTHRDWFIEIDSKLKIYKHSATVKSTEFIDLPYSFYQKSAMSKQKTEPSVPVENIQYLADQFLLQRFAPASVLVNPKGDIIYITGRTGSYLEPPAGKVNWNIHAMAREGLRQVLPGAFRKALQSFEAVMVRNIKIASNGAPYFVNITVQRIENPESIRGMIMVVFNGVSTPGEPEAAKSKPVKRSSTGRLGEMEIELQRSDEEMQSTREEMQTSQEEWQSINEELQSTNEELQSTNEELTTSKEEMQSLNEELQTVNIELQSKVSEFLRVNDDMKNLLNSTEIATLFLDKDLNVRSFTDPVTKIFKLREADIGRPFTDQVTDLLYPELGSHAVQVIKTLIFTETARTTKDGRWFNVRIMPYRTIDDRIDGLVITFTDITQAKMMEIKLMEMNEALRQKKKNN